MSTGRSRQEWIQSAYMEQMIASLVGRIASRSSSSRLPPWVTQNTSGAKPSTCSASLARTLSGISRGEVHVLVAGALEHGVERVAGPLPQGVAVGADDHAAAHRRVVGQLGAADHVDVPAVEVLALGRDLLGTARLAMAAEYRVGFATGSSLVAATEEPVAMPARLVRRQVGAEGRERVAECGAVGRLDGNPVGVGELGLGRPAQSARRVLLGDEVERGVQPRRE